jgi:iron complex outermembrane recepter protein
MQSRSINRALLLVLLGASSTLALASPAMSQVTEGAANNAEAQSQDESGLGEIVVTARKRAENLQDTPISVAAFSGETLEQKQVNSVGDLGRFTPNVSLEQGASISGSSSAVTAFIRGVGQTDFNLTIDPGVGLYVDGVYVSRSVGALLDTLDLEQVQVLRGPQGTLFGKNTIGGAIVLTSRKPSDKFELIAEATTGRYNRADGRLTVNIPLSETVSLRAGGSVQTRDGYVRRLFDGGKSGNKNSLSGRVQLFIKPTPDFSLLLAADGTRTREQAIATSLVAVDENAQFPFFHNKILNAASCGAPGTPTPRNDVCYTSRWITGDRFTTWAGGPNYSNLDLWGVSLTAEYDLGAATIKSITAYRDLKSSFYLDVDQSPRVIDETSNVYSQNQFSQEFQISGTAFNDRLKYLAGLYYLKEKGVDRNTLEFTIARFLSGGAVNNDSYAAFAQATYEVTDKFNLTLGARYTSEKKRFKPDQVILRDGLGGDLLLLSRCFVRPTPILPPNPTCAADPTFNPNGNLILPRTERVAKANEFTPAVTLDYKFNDDVLGYVSYSKGFKSGGFTQRVFPPLPEAPSFGPEFVSSYEIGLKTEFFDRKVRLNTAAFYTDYSDLQIIVADGIAPTVRNAGKARIKGFEAELEIAAIDRVRLQGGLGYTDAEYRTISPQAAPVTVNSQLPNAPKWTATANIVIDAVKADWGKVTLLGDWSYKSGHHKEAINSPGTFQPAYSLFGASVAVGLLDERLLVSVGGTNLSNKNYILTGYDNIGAQGHIEVTPARPREWYLRVKFKY